jgi:4,5-DOPA dioxygenase extradiol
VDNGQGLDYATWMPLSVLYASAKVPVVAVSLPAGGTPEAMMSLGRVPHRARHDAEDAPAEGWARAFDEWVNERLSTLDIPALIDDRRRAPHAHLSAPTAEYLDPLFFVLGATLQGDRVPTLFEGFQAGSLSLRTCMLVGRRKDDLRLPDELVGS